MKRIQYVFKTSSNWLHFGVIRMHLAEEMVAPRPDCTLPKTSSKVARRHQNAGPKMRPFSEPPGNVPILRGTKKRVRIPGQFLTPLLTLFFLNSQRQKSDYRFSFFKRSHSIQQHSSLSCCRFMDNDSNNILWLKL